MISIILFLLFTIIIGISAYNNREKLIVEKDKYSKTISKLGFIHIVVFFIAANIALVQPYSVEKIDSSGIGLKVNLIGNDRGVSDYNYVTGWVIYNSWTEQIFEYPTFLQHVEYDEQTVITKGGFQATIEPTFNYAIKKESIGDMFINLRKPLEQLEHGWLKTAIVGSINDVANSWAVDSIFNHREAFELAITLECNDRIGKWFTFEQLKTNIVPPAALTQAIESETKAIKEAQAELKKALTAEAKAQTIIATAKGDSAKLVIEASSKALAMKLQQKELTPEYIEYLKVQKWDGKYPTTMMGNSQGVMISVK
jgi:regulator of protease activity HflC (stomatin/prohibitin superfamily)